MCNCLVEELRRKRNELQRKLSEQLTPQTVIQFTEEEVTGGVPTREDVRQIKALLPPSLHRHKMHEIFVAHRLAGRTIIELPENKLAIRFETFYGGKYYESHYIVSQFVARLVTMQILQFDSKNEDLVLHKHTLPYFVPIEDIAKKNLNVDFSVPIIHYYNLFKLFMNTVCDYLHSFVSRREQLQQLQRHVGSMTDIVATASFSQMIFKTKVKNKYTI